MTEAAAAARKPAAGFVLSLIGGFIVLLFALLFLRVALVAGSTFQAIGDAVAGEAGDAAGGFVGTFLTAFALLAGAALLWKGKRVAGGALVVAFSILSLFFAAGGWLAGFAFGLVGGILGLLGK